MKLCDDGQSVACLAWVADGAIGDDYSYALVGTPCEMVYRRATEENSHWFVPDDLAERYPEDEALARLGAKSYRGEIFFDGTGRPIGHVFAMDDRPGVETSETRTFFRLVSQRVGSEFHRWRSETALQASEQKYRRVIENAAEGMYRTTVDGRYLEANDALARIHGCDSATEFLSHFVTASAVYVDPRDRDKLTDQLLRAGQATNFECAVHRKDGSIAWISVSGRSVYDGDGDLEGYEGFVTDMTAVKEVERRLHQAQKMEAVGQLTGGIAHDFNNLLGVIIGNLEIASDCPDDEEVVARSIRTAMQAADRGAALTQRLLAFSRKKPLRSEVVDLKSLLAGMSDLLQRTLGEAIEIIFNSDPKLWPCRADPAQLESAVLNLAINARDAMPQGGSLSVFASNVTLDSRSAAKLGDLAAGDYVLLSVTDTGFGMTKDVREHAFEPFFSTKDAGTGSGLGLSMVYSFAKQTGGVVQIRSATDKGTAIEIYLPRDGLDAGAREIEGETDDMPSAHGETVLIVEDDVDLRTLVVNILMSLGYEVLEAGNSVAALDQLERTPRISLLLSDVVLPQGMGGRELAAAVDERRPGLPVLFMSGYTRDSIIHHGRLDEGFQLLEKPFRKSDIAQAVRRALDGGWDT